MKVRWQFYFEFEDLNFERTYTYSVPVSIEDARMFGLPDLAFDAVVTIEAEKEKHGHVKQRGRIKILLPGYKETKDLAYSLATGLEQEITFSQRRIDIIWSFVSNELIPETPQEKEEIGENRFSWTMQMVNVPEKVPFDSTSVQKITSNLLIGQFNQANDAKNPIDRFIGLFKILEDLYGGHPLKTSFKNSVVLSRLALQHIEKGRQETKRRISKPEFEKLVDDLVDTRHQCAHLRSSVDFGIAYGDSRVQSEVEPLLIPLEILAWEAIKDQNTPALFEMVARRFPGTLYGELAATRAQELRDSASRAAKEKAKQAMQQQEEPSPPMKVRPKPRPEPQAASGNFTWGVVIGSFPKSETSKARSRLKAARAQGFDAQMIDTDKYGRLIPGLYAVVVAAGSRGAALSLAAEVQNYFGDAYAKRYHAACSRSPARANEHAHVAARFNKVAYNKEVTCKAHGFYSKQFKSDALFYFGRHLRIAFFCPLPGQVLQVIILCCKPCGHHKIGQ